MKVVNLLARLISTLRDLPACQSPEASSSTLLLRSSERPPRSPLQQTEYELHEVRGRRALSGSEKQFDIRIWHCILKGVGYAHTVLLCLTMLADQLRVLVFGTSESAHTYYIPPVFVVLEIVYECADLRSAGFENGEIRSCATSSSAVSESFVMSFFLLKEVVTLLRQLDCGSAAPTLMSSSALVATLLRRLGELFCARVLTVPTWNRAQSLLNVNPSAMVLPPEFSL